jgi:hypothetical protein
MDAMTWAEAHIKAAFGETMPDKKSLPVSNSVLGAFGSKTLSTAQAYMHGSTQVVELGFSDSTTLFIKFLQGQTEVGGTNEWNTGTKK